MQPALKPVINRNKIDLLSHHANSYWIDCLVYSRSFALPPVVFTTAVLQSPVIQQGIQLLTTGHPAHGIEVLKAVITDPEQLPLREAASVLMAAMLLLARYHQEAAQIWHAFAQDYPLDCHFPYYSALCDLKLGNPEAALANLEHALELQPAFIPAWGAIGLLAGLMRDHHTALEACDKALAAGHEIGNQLLSLCQFQARLELGLLPFSNQHFDSQLFEPISDAEHQALLQRLPPIQQGFASQECDNQLPLLFCAADNAYFHDHVVPLALSLIHSGSRCILHVHVVNPDAEVERRLRALAAQSPSLSVRLSFEKARIETIAPAALYYSCIRFCRFFQATAYHPGPALLVDADALFRQPLQTLLSSLAQQPRPVITHLPQEPIWQEVAAAFLLVDADARSRTFLAHTSAAILRHLLAGKGRWFLDQMALYVARKALRQSGQPSGSVAGSLVTDITHSDSSFIWQVTNDKHAPQYTSYRNQLLATYPIPGAPFNTVCQGQHGLIIANRFDQYIGRSLIQSGVWCEHEIDLLRQLLLPGDVVVEAGANYGAHTLALARIVGPSGQIHAFEPQRPVFQALTGTIALNSLTHVFTYHKAVGASTGCILVPRLCFEAADNFGALSLVGDRQKPTQHAHPSGDELVELTTIDCLALEACHLIKADVEGMELDVLRGAEQTIQRLRPVLYLENHADARRAPLIQHCQQLGYALYWHGTANDPNMLCIPQERGSQPTGLQPVV
ncbi:MAG: protein arginine N-methyltransferase [Cyanobacteriota bacterium]|nr:protein arginine N-methyltransferase [Cyanobacteriota bacterium]